MKTLDTSSVSILEVFCKYYAYYSYISFDSYRGNSGNTFLHIFQDPFRTISCTTQSWYIISWPVVMATVLEQNQNRSNLLCLCPVSMPRFCVIGTKVNIKSGCIPHGGQTKTGVTNDFKWSLPVYSRGLYQSLHFSAFHIRNLLSRSSLWTKTITLSSVTSLRLTKVPLSNPTVHTECIT